MRRAVAVLICTVFISVGFIVANKMVGNVLEVAGEQTELKVSASEPAVNTGKNRNESKIDTTDIKLQITIMVKIMVVLTVLVLGVYCANLALNKVKENREKKNAGYEANKNIEDIQVLLGMLEYEMDYIKDAYIRVTIKKIKKRLEEIAINYEFDKDKYNVPMYKYEKTFDTIKNSLYDAVEKTVEKDKQIYAKILEALEYPYNEIVGNGLVTGVLNDLDKEISILEQLDKLRNELQGNG